jgi:lipoprotein-anchoring transpeptidase ErfK/SrfK
MTYQPMSPANQMSAAAILVIENHANRFFLHIRCSDFRTQAILTEVTVQRKLPYVGRRFGYRAMRILSLGRLAFLTFTILSVSPSGARDIVHFSGYSAGTIVVKTNERRLYYVIGEGEAIRYPVGVGRAGMAWSGTASIDGKYIKPAWSAPASIRRDYSRLPEVIPSGSPANPMGAAALTLSGGGEYAIHGTNNPGSVGRFVSHGCIRMYNQDIMDLYERVGYGTKVVVLR